MTSEIKEFGVSTATCRGHLLDGVADPPVRIRGMGSGCDYSCLEATWNSDTETTAVASPGDRRPEVGSLAPRARHLEMRISPDGKSPMTAMARCGDVVPMVTGADMAPTALTPGAENDLSTSKASRRRPSVGSKWMVNDDAESTSTSWTRYRPASTMSAVTTVLAVSSSFWPFLPAAPIPLEAGIRET
ncbi:UNVERIFIED_CONTAM: hypothetical protein K2H54_000185 [Gekko kuhli]